MSECVRSRRILYLDLVLPDRATPNTDATLRRLEGFLDRATVPAIWQVEVANVLGKGVMRRKLTIEQAIEIWVELALLPITRSTARPDVPVLMGLAVRHNISVYDACYLQEAWRADLPLATNDHDLADAAQSYGAEVMRP